MTKHCLRLIAGLLMTVAVVSMASAQEKKLDKIRLGGGSASATQMTMWLAKEGNYYEKHGLDAETISIPGSSLALQAMLAGELPIIQLGGAASIQANFSGADTVIVATIVRKFLFSDLCPAGHREDGGFKGKGIWRNPVWNTFGSRFQVRAARLWDRT